MVQDLISIYERDLNRLKQEIESFRDESNLWLIIGAIKNPAGNLCQHLIGNLKIYIGKNIGLQNYQRDREAEFNSRVARKEDLLNEVDETKNIVISTLKNMQASTLTAFHIEDVFGYKMTNSFFLIHLASHLSYHLGQINYLRRALEP